MPAWIAVDAHLEDHPKFPLFCHASGLEVCRAVHCLIRLWSLVRRRGADGHVTGYSTSTLDRVLGYPMATQALIDAGYLSLDSEYGGFKVVGWEDWNGRWLLDAKRKRNERNKIASPKNVRGQSLDTPRMSMPSRSSEQEQDSERSISQTLSPSTRVARRSPSVNGYHEHPEFQAMYDAFPRHIGRRAAIRAFNQALRRHGDSWDPDDFTLAASEFRKRCEREARDPEYIPHPATWLNQDRFLEEVEDAPQDSENGDPAEHQ